MTNLILLAGLSALISTFWYLYLHKKTRIDLKYLYIDNLIVVVLSVLISYLFETLFSIGYFILIIPFISVFGFSFLIIMYRFWRTPNRKIKAKEGQIVSPADGNVIYIKKLDSDKIPISVKKGRISNLDELTKTELLKTPCWLIGINMTPFDIHKNCSPIDGKLTFQKHTHGKFLSLKELLSETENERNTFVIENDIIKVGVIQIASRKVRRIVSYVNDNETLKKGQIIGMIRFGSQVDVILPITCKIKIKLKQQIYAQKTIIAEI